MGISMKTGEFSVMATKLKSAFSLGMQKDHVKYCKISHYTNFLAFLFSFSRYFSQVHSICKLNKPYDTKQASKILVSKVACSLVKGSKMIKSFKLFIDYC